jgi:hypothetical protein
MISDVATTKIPPDEAAMTSLEKPVIDGTVEVIEDMRGHV